MSFQPVRRGLNPSPPVTAHYWALVGGRTAPTDGGDGRIQKRAGLKPRMERFLESAVRPVNLSGDEPVEDLRHRGPEGRPRTIAAGLETGGASDG